MKYRIGTQPVMYRSGRLLHAAIVSVFIMIITSLFFLVSIAQAQTTSVSVNETTCPEFGEWGGKTCVLQQDVNHPLVIDELGVFLDGNGHSIVVDDATAEAALLITSEKNKITNLVITSAAQTGIQISSSARRTVIEGVIILGANVGVQDSGQETQLNHLYIDGLGRAETGIKIEGPVNLVVTLTVIKNVETGIVASSTSRVTVAQALIDSVATGMSVTASEDITLTHSHLQNVTETGVYINASNRVTVEKSYLSGVASIGVHVQSIPDLDRVFIIGNSISDVSTGLLDTTPISQYEGQTKPRLFFRRNDVVEVGVTHTVPSVAQNLVQFTPNYWSDYDQDSEGCLDDNADDTCDAGYQRPAVDDVEYVISGVSHRVPFGDAADLAIPTCELVGPDSALVAESVSFDLVSDQTNQGFITRFGAFETSPDQADILFSRAGEFEIITYAWGPLTVPTRCTTSVTITDESQQVGASSVLFLPGIQASRLYTTESDGSEKLLWEPDFLFDDADMLRLAMTEAGESIEDIYVRDVIDYAPQDKPSAKTAVYGGFLQFLDQLVNEQEISEYSAFAYDWRYDVFDVVTDGVQYKDERRFLVAEVERLATNSATGKVAIVAHSNGGLLGKALIDEMDRQDKSDLIESLIMIGTPQLGTPKAIGSLLHGTDQGLSFDVRGLFELSIITDKAVREAARNMPGAYGLLPGQAYYEAAGDVLVLFDSGVRTESWRDSYGNALQSQSELDNFLTSEDNGRDNVPYSNTDQAIVANQVLLEEARSARHHLDTWQAPGGIAVSSITGTGLSTISGFEYVTITERYCSGSFCNPITFYRPKAIQSFRGDQTLMDVSGGGRSMAEQERYYVDLESVDAELDELFIHKNLTEAGIIQQLVSSLLSNTDVESNKFVNQTGFTYPDQQLFTYGGNSPVYLLVTDDQGRRTGQLDETTVVEEIPGSKWFTIGGATYVSVPTDIDHTVTMQAYGEGSVTLSVDEVTDNQQVLLYVAPIPIITSDTSIELVYQSSSFGQIQVDLDGDGSVDEVRDIIDGQIISNSEVEPEEILVPENNNGGSAGTRVLDRTAAPQVLGVSVSADVSSELLQAISAALVKLELLLVNNQLNTEQISVVTEILESLLTALSET